MFYLLTEDGSRLMPTTTTADPANRRPHRGQTLAAWGHIKWRKRRQWADADAGRQASRSPSAALRVVKQSILGTLGSDADLVGSGFWTLDTCGSTFVVEHPAYRYSFNLPQDGRVLIDLTSENGDPVLSLWSSTAGLISANDDGGEGRNSRIKRYLEAGVYLVEATTYLERDLQPLLADFTLTISLVDEDTELQGFLLKVEKTHAPQEVRRRRAIPGPLPYRQSGPWGPI